MMHDPSIEDRLRKIKQRAEAATNGPWINHEAEEENPQWWGPFPHNAPTCLVEAGADNHPICCTNDDGIATEQEVANAEFIAHAREDIPYLLELLENAGLSQGERLRPAAGKERDA